VLKGGRVSATSLPAFSAAEIVKHYATRAGLDPRTFAGHSLRAGFLTSAADAGASVFKMMDVSRHKSVNTLRGYVRNAESFKDSDAERARPCRPAARLCQMRLSSATTRYRTSLMCAARRSAVPRGCKICTRSCRG
jgi:site-specific recombinase XerD